MEKIETLELAARIINLGACWPVLGAYHGPTISTGADGSDVFALHAVRDGRHTELVFGNAPAGMSRKLRAMLEARGCDVTPLHYFSDDVASHQVTLDQFEDHCADTGLMMYKWKQAGEVPVAAWVSTDHGLFYEIREAAKHSQGG